VTAPLITPASSRIAELQSYCDPLAEALPQSLLIRRLPHDITHREARR